MDDFNEMVQRLMADKSLLLKAKALVAMHEAGKRDLIDQVTDEQGEIDPHRVEKLLGVRLLATEAE